MYLPLWANSPDGSMLTFQAVGLPAGLTLDPANGVISGTIDTAAGSATPYKVTVLVSNGQSSSFQTFAWIVKAYNPVSMTNPGPQWNTNGDIISLRRSGPRILPLVRRLLVC